MAMAQFLTKGVEKQKTDHECSKFAQAGSYNSTRRVSLFHYSILCPPLHRLAHSLVADSLMS